MKTRVVYSIIAFFFCIPVFSQDSLSQKKFEKIRHETSKLKNAIKKNDPKTTAASYFNLGETLYKEGNYTESEPYLIKSKEIYLSLQDKEKAAKVGRVLAKTQEALKKTQEALNNYKEVAEYEKEVSPVNYTLNQNDYKRLESKNSNNTFEQRGAIESNLELQSQMGSADELAESYSNLADLDLEDNLPDSAIANYTQAYNITKDKAPKKAVEYTQKITDVLVETNQVDKAISLKKEVLQEEFIKEDSKSKVTEIQSLANLYLTNQNQQEAINLLKKSYEISIEKGHTLEAQKSVRKLDSIYTLQKKVTQSLALYQDFIQHLPAIIEKDNTLFNQKLLKETSEKIQQLEEEKRLKDELIKRKNLFNYSLLGSVSILIILIIIILHTLRKVKVRNKKIALQSLRREMNPHFIFNSLNSINQFIAENNELEANQYLSHYSKLMRNVMEYSKDDFISFHKEIEFLTHYVDLEKKRFQDKFDYQITIDPELQNLESFKVPSMLLQPHIENAVWHGLRYLDQKGLLRIDFSLEGKIITVKIEDNGIGLEKSKEHKTAHQKQRESRGLKNTQERIDLLNHLYKKNIQYTLSKPSSGKGVLVTIKFDL